MKLLLEVLPLVVFFICYKLFGIVGATYAIVVTSVISIVMHYLVFKNIPKAMIISTGLVAVMGGATVVSGDSYFIKMKPTLFFAAISCILFYGVCIKKYYIKVVFGQVFVMSDEAWNIVSRRVIVFFILMSILNEYIWRSFSEDTWVSFKVFGFFPILLVFMLLQLPLLNKYNERKILKK
ncbi:MAG: septation protein IspZ [Rickettsiales bacterium]|nr:septation protein IspZ [Rickettsiales bacterium]